MTKKIAEMLQILIPVLSFQFFLFQFLGLWEYIKENWRDRNEVALSRRKCKFRETRVENTTGDFFYFFYLLITFAFYGSQRRRCDDDRATTKTRLFTHASRLIHSINDTPGRLNVSPHRRRLASDGNFRNRQEPTTKINPLPTNATVIRPGKQPYSPKFFFV